MALAIPSSLRIFLGTIEPLAALGGVYALLSDPERYLASLDPDGDHSKSMSTATRMAMIQLAGTWAMFSAIKAWQFRTVLARSTTTAIIKAALLSDAFFITSLIPLGRSLLTHPTALGLSTVLMTVTPALARLYVLLRC